MTIFQLEQVNISGGPTGSIMSLNPSTNVADNCWASASFVPGTMVSPDCNFTVDVSSFGDPEIYGNIFTVYKIFGATNEGVTYRPVHIPLRATQ